MEETLDFSNAKLEDFKLATAPKDTPSGIEEAQVSESVPEQVQIEEPVSKPVENPAQEPPKQSEPVDTNYKWKDDFIKGVVEFYEKTGDLTPYLQAKTVDFSSMSDEEIVRRNLREQYSDLSDKAFDRLYKQQVIDKYKLDAEEYGEDDSELGKELLRAEASRLRAQYTDWQKNFRAPEPVNEDSAAQELAERFIKEVQENDYTQKILNDKRISIKIGDGEFNYEIPDAESLLGMTVDNDKFFEQFALGQGKLDYAKWYKTAAYSQNPELFEKALINYGKAIGREEVTKEIKNPSNINLGGDAPTESSGDFTTGLLQAFATRGIKK